MQDFANSINTGLHHNYELCANLVNLAVRIDQEKDKKYEGHKIYLNTLSKSIVIFEYNLLEAVSNLINSLTLSLNERIFSGGPAISSNLEGSEVDFLLEREEKLENGISSFKNKFRSTADKLEKVPYFFGKLFDVSFKLDKGNSGWGKFKELENLRHSIVHPKLDFQGLSIKPINNILLDFDSIISLVTIEPSDLFNGLISLRWYIRELKKLIDKIDKIELKPFSKGFELMDCFFFMSMESLSSYCGETEGKINKLFPKL